MTTLTEPPLITPAIDVAELPAWDQPDERVCEMGDRNRTPNTACGRPATWVATMPCPSCGPIAVLMCSPCRWSVPLGHRIFCDLCDGVCTVTRVEPIR